MDRTRPDDLRQANSHSEKRRCAYMYLLTSPRGYCQAGQSLLLRAVGGVWVLPPSERKGGDRRSHLL